MKLFFLSLIVLVSQSINAQKSLPEDAFSPLFEHHWTGTLTYLDYSSNKEVAIPVEMDVTPTGGRPFKLAFTYPIVIRFARWINKCRQEQKPASFSSIFHV